MNTISLVMIVKNESSKLPRCLESISGIVDEIVVVDTGSIDDTVKIAKSYDAKIFEYKWNDNFAEARNFSLQQSTGDWNLVLDADEYIINNCKDSIREFTSGNQAIGRIRRIDKFQQNGEIKHAQAFISRLIPKGVYYKGRIHEQIESHLPTVNIAVEVYHDGYFDNPAVKSDRNIYLLLLELQESPNDPYFLFQIAQEYKIAGEYLAAKEYFKKCYPLLSEHDGIRSKAIVEYLYNVLATGDFELGLELIHKEQNNLADYPDFHFVSGLLYMELIFNNIEKYIHLFSLIEKEFLTCLSLGDDCSRDSVLGTGSFLASYNVGVFYETLGDTAKAKKYYQNSAEHQYARAVERLRNL